MLAGVVLLGVLTRAMSPSMNHYILTQDKNAMGGLWVTEAVHCVITPPLVLAKRSATNASGSGS